MKTLFDNNTMMNRTPWNPSYRMGQLDTTPVSESERNRILNQINTGLTLVRPIEDLIAWSVANDTNLANTLGPSNTRFFAISNEIAVLFPKVKAVFDRMSSADPESWVILSTDELPAVDAWTQGVADMNAIYMAHTGGRVINTVPVAVPYPVGVPVPTAVPPLVVESEILGVPTTQILIGGAVAVGVVTLLLVL